MSIHGSKATAPRARDGAAAPAAVARTALDVVSPRLRAFLAYWAELRGEREMPARAEFDVRDVPRPIVAHLILLDVLDGGRAFRYRVVGTGVVAEIGREFTGETVEQYRRNHEGSSVQEGYAEVVRTGRANLYHGNLRDQDREHVVYERLAVPFAGPDGGVSAILACFDFDRPRTDEFG